MDLILVWKIRLERKMLLPLLDSSAHPTTSQRIQISERILKKHLNSRLHNTLFYILFPLPSLFSSSFLLLRSSLWLLFWIMLYKQGAFFLIRPWLHINNHFVFKYHHRERCIKKWAEIWACRRWLPLKMCADNLKPPVKKLRWSLLSKGKIRANSAAARISSLSYYRQDKGHVTNGNLTV